MTYRQLISILEIVAKHTDGGIDSSCTLECISGPVDLYIPNIDKWTKNEIDLLRNTFEIGKSWDPVSTNEINIWKSDSDATDSQIRKLLKEIKFVHTYL